MLLRTPSKTGSSKYLNAVRSWVAINTSANSLASIIKFHPNFSKVSMRNLESASALTVPPSVLAALHISATDPVHWEVRNGQAVLKAAAALRSVDAVAGMLAPQLKGRRIRWGAVADSAREAWGRVR
jgi:antitoxin component of MazEF toxin-antitoxin module